MKKETNQLKFQGFYPPNCFIYAIVSMFTIDILPWLSAEHDMIQEFFKIRVDSFTAAAYSQHKSSRVWSWQCRYPPVSKNNFHSFDLGLISCVSLCDIKKVKKKTKPARMLFCVTVKSTVLLVIFGMISWGTINMLSDFTQQTTWTHNCRWHRFILYNFAKVKKWEAWFSFFLSFFHWSFFRLNSAVHSTFWLSLIW